MSAEEPQRQDHVQRAPDRQNPRRVTAEASVSLRKAFNTGPLSFVSDQPSVGDVSAASMVVANGEEPTLPSGKKADQTNADQWFDDSNKNAAGKTNVKFIEDDPPFYLKKQRSSEGEGEDSRGQFSLKSGNARGPIPYVLRRSNLQSNSSTSDDFRSVIDDLTVENQELKRKLRKYEGMHCEHLQDDKLFEVRVFGLSQSRRRKLENILREFVQNVGTSPPESLGSNVQPYLATVAAQPAGPTTKRSDSSTSNRPVDSAYASMSATNTASGSQTRHVSAEPHKPIRPAPSAPPKDQAVQSYLQNISHGLLPKYPPFMTEKAKKRLVVRRLEQLFVGRGGTADRHSQSAQQQEVSQSAANADRRETEAMGHRVQAEGRREAKMSKLAQLTALAMQTDALEPSANGNGFGNGSTAATPDQRPTRPLDLDPSRAQNPAETISYMKHLGFSSPKMDPAKIAREEDGWVPLNLLINMAQLHTLNVTPDFVRAAISDLSSKFELSEDVQNVRWRGGHRGSKLSSDGSQNSEGSNDSPPDDNGAGHRKENHSKSKGGMPEVMTDGYRARTGAAGGFKALRHWPNSQNRAEHQYYSPLFYYPEETNLGSPTQDISSNSMNQTEDKSNEISRESSAENKSSSHTTRETGSLIFYRKAKFCTDLRGDPTFPASNMLYDRKTVPAIGIDGDPAEDPPIEPKGAISSPRKETTFDGDYNAGDADVEDNMEIIEIFPSSSHPKSNNAPDKHLIASGIGGITPADNFCIDAKRKFGETGNSELVDEQLRELDPTPLPPPSYAFVHFSSSGSDVDESDVGDSGDADDSYANSVGQFATQLNERHFIPPNLLITGAPGAGAGGYSSNSTGANGTTAQLSMDTSDGSSFDMLEFARKADPEMVAAQEREFDSNISMPDAQPPASVAATIGDRSTFITSQDDTASMEEGHLRMMQKRKSGNLKREHSSTGSLHRNSKLQRTEDAGDTM